MPIYEYRCKECHQLFEEWCRHIEDDNVTHNCPICKGQAQRLVSHTSFALKGGGWYVTEYGSHKGKKEESHVSTSADASGGSCSQSADKTATSKPAAASSTSQ